jgi:hypothetical protein
MRLTNRSYPHPVVGNRDDVPGAAFQAVTEMSRDKIAVYIDASIACSSDTINNLVRKEHATFVLHVECSNTLYRRVFEFPETKHRIEIPVDHLNDAVDVNVFARAMRNLSGYRVDGAHADYRSVGFDVEKGDILAVGEGQTFYIESNFDAMSPIGSIIEIHESPSDGDAPMTVSYTRDKIEVYLSKPDFKEYKMLKSIDGLSMALSTAIVTPVLVEAIHTIRNDADDDLRWVRVLRRRIDDLALTKAVSKDEEPIVLAQLFLELPMKRTLASVRMQMDSGGES